MLADMVGSVLRAIADFIFALQKRPFRVVSAHLKIIHIVRFYESVGTLTNLIVLKHRSACRVEST